MQQNHKIVASLSKIRAAMEVNFLQVASHGSEPRSNLLSALAFNVFDGKN